MKGRPSVRFYSFDSHVYGESGKGVPLIWIVPQQILDLFPLEDSLGNNEIHNEWRTSLSARLKHVQGSFEIQRPISAEEGEYVATINRPGACYSPWQKPEDISGNGKLFLEKAGRHPH